MKKLNRFLATFMVVAMMLTAAPLSGFVGLELNLDWLNFDWFDFYTQASAEFIGGTCGENITWSYDEIYSDIIISGTGPIENYSSDSEQPWHKYTNNARNITIEHGITSIGDYACMNGWNVEKLAIPDSVTHIGESAFYSLSMSRLAIPDSVTTIGDSAFQHCSELTTIVMSENVTTIEPSTFSYCSSLTSISIYPETTHIKEYAFYETPNLTDIYYHGTPEQWEKIIVEGYNDSILNATVHFNDEEDPHVLKGTCGENATWFLDDKKQELIISGSGAMDDYISAATPPPWEKYGYAIRNIRIGNEITYIGDHAFSDILPLKKVTIPDGVKTIAPFAFAYCPRLSDITIGKNVERIGQYAFSQTAYYENEENWENGEVLYVDNALVDARYVLAGNYEIRPGTRIIADYALSACKYELTGIIIPETVESIGVKVLESNDLYEQTSYTGNIEQWKQILINSNNRTLVKKVLFECKSGRPYYGGVCGDNITWSLYRDSGELILDGSGEMYDYTGTYGGFSPWYDFIRFVKSIEIKEGITYIGDFAFESCINANEATIPNTVTSIGANAFDSCFHFYRSNIVIPDSVISIGNECFRDCASLESIVLPSGITTIPSYMFYECNALKSITIPDTVTSIGSSAFRKCTSLTSVTIPENVKDIGYSAFKGCESLENLTIPDNVETIESGAFEGCTSLRTVNLGKGVNNIEDAIIKDCDSLEAIYVSEANPSYSSDENGVLFNKDKTKLIRYPENNSKTSYTVPDGVKTIGSKAFYDCGNLESIILPESVVTISTDVFYHCVALESITIPKNVTSIATDTFSHCESLTGIYVDESNTAYSSDEYGVLFDKNKTQLIRYPEGRISETYEIPKTVTSLATRSFRLCHGPEKLTIPDHVTSLGNSVFNYNYGLKYVVIGNGIKSINYEDFNYCWALETMVLPSSVTFIDRFAVIYCDKLTDVYYAGSQEQWEAIDIRPYNELSNKTIHYNCVGLDTVSGSCGNSLTWTFNPKNNELIISGTGKMTDYSSASLPPWYAFKLQITKLTVQPGVTTIGNDTFIGCTNIEEVTLPETLTKIGNSAFRDCTSLKEIAIPDSVTSLGYYAFYGCTGFEEIIVGNGVKTIGNHAFRMCSNLKTVTLPVSLTTVSKNAFNECTSLSTVNYLGTSTQWASVTIAESNDPLISATLICIGDIHKCEYGEWVVTLEPTATTDGEKVHTCIECGEAEAVTIPATGFEPAEGVTIDFATNTISGFNAGEASLDGYTTTVNDNYVWEYEAANGKLGTGSKAILKDGDTIIGEYTILVYGDTTGDSWYDGQDAIIVDCLANGMLTKEDVGEAVYTAADCNHDGVIDQLDVALLNEAGTLLANVDQTMPAEVLLETSSAYVEYLDLIDQTPEIEVEDETDAPEADAEDSEPIEENSIFTFISEFIAMLQKLFKIIFGFVNV